MRNKDNNKFQYNTEFQEKILGYTIKDDNGYKALELYKDYYFDLIEHQVIAAALKHYYKTKGKLPRDRAILKEELRLMYTKKEFKESLLKTDKERIDKLVNKLYKRLVTDGDDLLEACTKFASFVEFKEVLEGINITDFNSYEAVIKKLQSAVNRKSNADADKGIFLVQDIRQRQIDRKNHEPVHPFPFWQLNALTNAGGYSTGALFTLLDKAKGFKTGVMINLIKGYMRMKKNCVIFDLENGQDSMAIRAEQALANKSKPDILSGEHNRAVQKIMRQYQRIGVEVVIKRLPAYSTANDLEKWLDYWYNEFGLVFKNMFIDYIGLMGSTQEYKDDNARISNAYLEVKNLAERRGIQHTWTPHHISKLGYARRPTKYEATDTAKCLEIHRHVDGMFGVNQNDEEKEGNVYRIEVIDQRDGVPEGRVYLWGNEVKQRVTEFTKNQLSEYLEMQDTQKKEEDSPASDEKRSKVKSDI